MKRHDRSQRNCEPASTNLSLVTRSRRRLAATGEAWSRSDARARRRPPRRRQPADSIGIAFALGRLISPPQPPRDGYQILGIALRPRVGLHRSHRFRATGPTGFAGDSACNNAIALPSTPSWLGRRRAAYSGCEQRGQVSPTAHNTVTGTADRQTGQRTRARSTIGLSSGGSVRRADPDPLNPAAPIIQKRRQRHPEERDERRTPL